MDVILDQSEGMYRCGSRRVVCVQERRRRESGGKRGNGGGGGVAGVEGFA